MFLNVRCMVFDAYRVISIKKDNHDCLLSKIYFRSNICSIAAICTQMHNNDIALDNSSIVG